MPQNGKKSQKIAKKSRKSVKKCLRQTWLKTKSKKSNFSIKKEKSEIKTSNFFLRRKKNNIFQITPLVGLLAWISFGTWVLLRLALVVINLTIFSSICKKSGKNSKYKININNKRKNF